MKNNVWQFIPVVKKACSVLNILNLVCEITLAHASSEKSDMAGNFHDIYTTTVHSVLVLKNTTGTIICFALSVHVT